MKKKCEEKTRNYKSRPDNIPYQCPMIVSIHFKTIGGRYNKISKDHEA